MKQAQITYNRSVSLERKENFNEDTYTILLKTPDDAILKISDGYHTMDELYDHRITLYIAFCRLRDYANYMELATNPYTSVQKIWRSKKHSDGELCFGTGTQFVLGIGIEEGEQITYHIPIERWEETDFAETFENAPEYDNHTSQNVLERLKLL